MPALDVFEDQRRPVAVIVNSEQPGDGSRPGQLRPHPGLLSVKRGALRVGLSTNRFDKARLPSPSCNPSAVPGENPLGCEAAVITRAPSRPPIPALTEPGSSVQPIRTPAAAGNGPRAWL